MRDRELVFALVFLVQISPVAGDVAFEKTARAFAGFVQCRECAGAGNDSAKRKPRKLHDRSRKPASLAVARNCGIGSSCLNADVKAFERLHIVRGWNSSCCGEKYRS